MSVLILFTAALIWGTAFVAQSVGMDHLGPFSFNFIRFFIGGITLLPLILITAKKRRRLLIKENPEQGEILYRKETKNSLIGGGLAGLFLASASMFQQYALLGTTVSKIGFITSLYIIFVPVICFVCGKRYHLLTWISIGISFSGFFCMCLSGNLSINRYDYLGLIAAVLFAFHILVVDRYAPISNSIAISGLQLLVGGSICLIGTVLFEHITLEMVWNCRFPLLYTGILSCGVAYTFQIIGQRGVSPVLATLILSLESVVSGISGWIILKQPMSNREIIGAILVFSGVLLVQTVEIILKKDI